MKNKLTTEVVRKAIELAYLSYPQHQIATKITSLALKQLQTEWKREKRWQRDSLKIFLDKVKDFFFFDQNLANQDKIAKKIFFTQEQLLQLLVLKCGNDLEKQQEDIENVNQGILLIRAIKEIVWFTLERSPLYVISGFTKVIHNYNYQDTIAIFCSLDNSYKFLKDIKREIRRAKEAILNQVSERFREATENVSTSDNLFNRAFSRTVTSGLLNIYYQCLEKLSPWDTECIKDLPAKNSISKQQITKGTEIVHSLIHNNCFELITELIEVAKPSSQLQIEQFIFSSKRTPPNNDPFDPPDFTDDAVNLLNELEEYKKSLKNSNPEQLSVFIDNKKVGIIDLEKTNSFEIEISDQATQLTIYDEKTDLLLLSSRLIHQGILSEERLEKYYFHLSNSQTFKLTIKAIKPIFLSPEPLDDEENEDYIDGKFEIKVACYERNPIKAVSWSYKHLMHEVANQPMKVASRFAAIAVVFTLLFILIGQLKLSPNFNNNQQPIIVKKSPTPSLTPKPSKLVPIPLPEKSPSPKRNEIQPNKLRHNLSLPKTTPKVMEQVEQNEIEEDQIAMVRGNNPTFASIQTIYVSDLMEEDLRKALTELLQSNGKFTVVKSLIGTSPDATLEWSFSQPNLIILSINNRFVWKKAVDPSALVKTKAEAIVFDLIQAVEDAKAAEKEKLERKQKQP